MVFLQYWSARKKSRSQFHQRSREFPEKMEHMPPWTTGMQPQDRIYPRQWYFVSVQPFGGNACPTKNEGLGSRIHFERVGWLGRIPAREQPLYLSIITVFLASKIPGPFGLKNLAKSHHDILQARATSCKREVLTRY